MQAKAQEMAANTTLKEAQIVNDRAEMHLDRVKTAHDMQMDREKMELEKAEAIAEANARAEEQADKRDAENAKHIREVLAMLQEEVQRERQVKHDDEGRVVGWQ